MTADLTTQQVAQQIRASTETVRALIASGDLPAYRLRGTNGPYRIQPDALDTYRANQTNRDPWARTTNGRAK